MGHPPVFLLLRRFDNLGTLVKRRGHYFALYYLRANFYAQLGAFGGMR